MQVHLLSDPVGFITGAIGNFVAYGYDPETARFRFGNMGTGKMPNYKIEKLSHERSIEIGNRQFPFTETPSHTFSGRNHREMVELDDHPRHGRHWSSETMTFAELKALLARLSESQSKH